MRIKLDENIPEGAAAELAAKGHDVATVLGQGMGSWSDGDLWRAVQHEDRLLITRDKGFADLRSYPPGSHCGVLLLRPSKSHPGEVVRFLSNVASVIDLDELAGCVAVATPRGVRIRRPR